MPQITAVLTLFDGSIIESSFDRIDLARLRDAGLKGRALITKLFGDDVRPPPRFVDFDDIASDGTTLSVRLIYE